MWARTSLLFSAEDEHVLLVHEKMLALCWETEVPGLGTAAAPPSIFINSCPVAGLPQDATLAFCLLNKTPSNEASELFRALPGPFFGVIGTSTAAGEEEKMVEEVENWPLPLWKLGGGASSAGGGGVE
jgi:hypothetical protein